jgi:hypothetical protein
MVLTKSELIASLQKEVRILVHLASKIDRTKIDYRPTPKQRSTIELLRYLSTMGPILLQYARTGEFDRAMWSAATEAAEARDLDQTIEAIASQSAAYGSILGAMADDELRAEIKEFDGSTTTRGAFLVNHLVCACAAYRTQLFLYLKACGREELTTMNLWAGIDPPAAPATV